MQQTADEMAARQIGMIEKITISGNRGQVSYNLFKHQKHETLRQAKTKSNTLLAYKVNYVHIYRTLIVIKSHFKYVTQS